MKVGIIQSNFLPWRGYFDTIREVDLFIVYDDVQYTRRDWRNRNTIKTPRGLEWITVPVKVRGFDQQIQHTPVDYSTPWAGRILNKIRDSYVWAPHFEPYFSELTVALNQEWRTISQLNQTLIHWACRHLKIDTRIVESTEFRPRGSKTERIVDLVQQAGGDVLLAGPSARNYFVPELFDDAGIRLEYKAYDYATYEQLYPPFEPNVSIIDALFMNGPDTHLHVRPRASG